MANDETAPAPRSLLTLQLQHCAQPLFQHFSIYCPAPEQVVALIMPRVAKDGNHTDDFRGGRLESLLRQSGGEDECADELHRLEPVPLHASANTPSPPTPGPPTDPPLRAQCVCVVIARAPESAVVESATPGGLLACSWRCRRTTASCSPAPPRVGQLPRRACSGGGLAASPPSAPG